jgi:hypothetical protein
VFINTPLGTSFWHFTNLQMCGDYHTTKNVIARINGNLFFFETKLDSNILKKTSKLKVFKKLFLELHQRFHQNINISYLITFKTKNYEIVIQTSCRIFFNNKYSTNQIEGLKTFCKTIECVIRIPRCTFIDWITFNDNFHVEWF